MGKTLVFTDLKVFSVPLCLRGEDLVCERPRRSQLEVEFRTLPKNSPLAVLHWVVVFSTTLRKREETGVEQVSVSQRAKTIRR